MKNKFHVIFCSVAVERNLGMANLLAATKDCLSETSDAAVLLTIIELPNVNLTIHIKNTPADYPEIVLCCPLSIVPTLYGMRLLDHLKLGSPDCIKMHDPMVKHFLTLKWLKATGFSTNIKLDIVSLKKAIGLLTARRLYLSVPNPISTRLYTYYIIMQSLVDRCPPLQDIPTLHSPIQTEVQDEVSQELRLACKTEKAWLNGEPVLAHSFGKWRRQLRIDMSEKYRFRTNSILFICC